MAKVKRTLIAVAAMLALSACGIVHSDSVNKKAVLTCTYKAGNEIDAAMNHPYSNDPSWTPGQPTLDQARADYNWCFTAAGLMCQIPPGSGTVDFTKCLTRSGKPWIVTNGDVWAACRDKANAQTSTCQNDGDPMTTPTTATGFSCRPGMSTIPGPCYDPTATSTTTATP